MSDSAKGPIAGYLFQFEMALLLLSKLDNCDDKISIEEVDDIAVHNDADVLIMTLQAKNSISPSGTTFEDTSYALWRTLEIWIQKLQSNIFNNETKFVCCTNKKIASSSLLSKIKNEQFSSVIAGLKALQKDQEEKLRILLSNDPASGKTVKQTIKFIKHVLKHPKEFEIVKNNLEIEDEVKAKEKFLVKIHMMSDLKTDAQRDNLYETFYGWITYVSYSKWKNSTMASFTKKDFDNKLAFINSSPSIVNAIFRTKQLIGSISENDIDEKKRALFVKQIEDISRNQEAKTRKIRQAITDFIYSDIEISYIITTGNFTKKDFDDFLDECFERWQECFDNYVIKELNIYNEEEKNEIAIKIFSYIMGEVDVKFKEDIPFTTGNKYIRNGSFLKLSNVPTIGWHPEWKTKYLAPDETK